MTSKLTEVSIAALMAVALAACGGSDSSSDGGDTTPAASIVAETESAAADVVADVTEEATDVAADVTEAAEDTAADVVETAENAAADVVEGATGALDAVVEEATDAVEDAADQAADAVSAVVEEATDRVSAETIAAYAALTGDAAKGKRVFTRCLSCHVVQDGVNRVGPSLYGIVGRQSGSVPGFKYSTANAESGVTWTEATLFAYLENPRQFIPGTIMAFPGLPSAQDRADVIAYLKAESS